MVVRDDGQNHSNHKLKTLHCYKTLLSSRQLPKRTETDDCLCRVSFWELPRCNCESWWVTSWMSVRANTCCEQIKPVVSQVTGHVTLEFCLSSWARLSAGEVKVNNGGYVVTGSRCALHINRPETLTVSFSSDVNEIISHTTWLILCLWDFFLVMTKMCLFKSASNSWSS